MVHPQVCRRFSYLTGGGFTGFRPPGSGNWIHHVSHSRDDLRSFFDQLGPIWISLIAVGILVVIAIFVVLTWVRSRGHFVFIDCIVRNRAAIVEPWNEYRVEGNSYFVFSLLIGLAIFGLILLVALFVIVSRIVPGAVTHQRSLVSLRCSSLSPFS